MKLVKRQITGTAEATATRIWSPNRDAPAAGNIDHRQAGFRREGVPSEPPGARFRNCRPTIRSDWGQWPDAAQVAQSPIATTNCAAPDIP